MSADNVSYLDQFAVNNYSTGKPVSGHVRYVELIESYDLKSDKPLLLNKSSAVKPMGNIYKWKDDEPAYNTETNSVSATLNAENMVDKIKLVFGLNNVQVADLIGISRPSLYNHISGKEQPNSLDNYKKYFDIADYVQQNVSIDIKPGLKSILVNGKTLLAHLKSSDTDQEIILQVAQQIAEKLQGQTLQMPSITEQRRAVRANTVQG